MQKTQGWGTLCPVWVEEIEIKAWATRPCMWDNTCGGGGGDWTDPAAQLFGAYDFWDVFALWGDPNRDNFSDDQFKFDVFTGGYDFNFGMGELLAKSSNNHDPDYSEGHDFKNPDFSGSVIVSVRDSNGDCGDVVDVRVTVNVDPSIGIADVSGTAYNPPANDYDGHAVSSSNDPTILGGLQLDTYSQFGQQTTSVTLIQQIIPRQDSVIGFNFDITVYYGNPLSGYRPKKANVRVNNKRGLVTCKR